MNTRSKLPLCGTALAAALLVASIGSMAAAQELTQDAALRHVRENPAQFGAAPADVADIAVTDSYLSRHTGVTHVYVGQRYNGIEIYQALANIAVGPDGRILRAVGSFVPGVAAKARGQRAILSPAEAAVSLADALQLGNPVGLELVRTSEGVDRASRLSSGGVSRAEIPARLVYHQTAGGGLRLAWDLEVQSLVADNWWSARVDAESGLLLAADDLVDYEQYQVYPIPIESPGDASPAPPADARTIAVDPYLDGGSASPFGWHDTNGVAGAEFTITRGNNVHAYADVDGNNIPDPGNPEPNGGAGLDFTGGVVPLDLSLAPSTYRQAAMANLFYWNNITHDVMWQYGFDEPSGNFQANNYGNGGLGNDHVLAEAQNAGNCNANFGTPSDGSSPRMQMFVCTTANPDRDSDLDAEVIVHEYGHGISNRLTGGPAQAGCLGNTEQMGEGWSDFFALLLTMKASAVGTEARGMGTYFVGQAPNGPGIRNAPYSTDFGVNGFTYNNVGSVAVPHGVGFIWATMLWDMTWNLIDAHGLNPDIYDAWNTGGNNLAMQLVIDGLKLQECSPGFVDGRNAILAADDLLTGDGSPGSGANQCLIWDAFAGRGLGFSASQGSSQSVSDGTPAFDLPPYCATLGSPNPNQEICQGGSADFTIGAGFQFADPPVTLAVTSGQPAGTTVGFSPNPIAATPGTSVFTISNTGAVAPGTYPIQVTGTDTNPTAFNTTVNLDVFATIGAGPTLTLPADGAVGEPVLPTLTWQALAGATSYTVEVDDDPGFGSINVTASGIAGLSYTLTAELAFDTVYHWRVRGNNPCGAGANSAARNFRTLVFPGACPAGTSVQAVFSDDFESGVGGWTSNGTGNTWILSGARTNSGANAFFAVDPAATTDQRLVSPSIILPAIGGGVDNLTLQFFTYQAFETPNGDGRCWDAGVLEVSTNDGSTWAKVPQSALLTDPYDNILWNDTPGNNPISTSYGATEAWCAELQPYLASVVDLTAWAGSTVRFRWRLGSDGAAGNEGWYIDDVVVQACSATPLFSDGFESGNTSAWSATVP